MSKLERNSGQPTTYKRPDWAVDQFVRASGLVEDICEHGVGHPNKEWLEANKNHPQWKALHIHGCDGCCQSNNEEPDGQ